MASLAPGDWAVIALCAVAYAFAWGTILYALRDDR